ncbi:hypothetical protein [Paenibacillus aceris]|uniref:Proteinase inhibitor n=1 Tax=Paenibacillus aceris TaxID=869555 RepID=A0ABS4HZZ3_9BACL|nr:hypothetical protein [Paenibacillus aceris]MBP1963866.1 hypothetical protein [Paenibacillus aceris]NHW34713.1 hypothetical protein [Paenibacillus aceris]
MKRLFLLMVLTVMFSILACTSQPVQIKNTNLDGTDSANMEYSVGLTSPRSANKNTDFTIEAKFTNNKDSEIHITHGEKLFTFYISNSNGNIINHYPRTSLGIARGVPRNGAIVERYTFNIDLAGQYEVWAVANFDINKKYELSTQKQTLVVQ